MLNITLPLVIIIGDSGVGKTNLLGRWIKNEFAFTSVATINVDWSSKCFRVKDKLIQITFCDTAGQERYRSLTRQYFRNAHGVVLVYDITDRSTFRHIDIWIDEVRSAASEFDPVLLMIGNKSDLVDKRSVSLEEAQRRAEQENMFFLETSARQGYNCAKSMQLLLQHIHHKFEKSKAPPEVKTEKPEPVSETINISNFFSSMQTTSPTSDSPTTEECSC